MCVHACLPLFFLLWESLPHRTSLERFTGNINHNLLTVITTTISTERKWTINTCTCHLDFSLWVGWGWVLFSVRWWDEIAVTCQERWRIVSSGMMPVFLVSLNFPRHLPVSPLLKVPGIDQFYLETTKCVWNPGVLVLSFRGIPRGQNTVPVPFLGLSLLPNPTETLAMQATRREISLKSSTVEAFVVPF